MPTPFRTRAEELPELIKALVTEALRYPPAQERARLRSLIHARVTIDSSTGCWRWRGGSGSHGYGLLSQKVAPGIILSQPVHRVAYIAWNGSIEEGLFVCHRCNVKKCCNPEHLYADSHENNMRHAWRDGLLSIPPRIENNPGWTAKRLAALPRGEQHPRSKLTAERIRLLRAAHAAGATIASLVGPDGVVYSTVRRAVVGERWRTL